MKKLIIVPFLALLFFSQVNISISFFGLFLQVKFGNENNSAKQDTCQDSTMEIFKDFIHCDTSYFEIEEKVKKIVDCNKYLYDTIPEIPQDKVLKFIEENKSLCIEAWDKGVLPSVKMAQAIIESASGSSDVCKNANNHFGIKCFVCDTTYKGYQFYDSKEHSFASHNRFFRSNRFRHLLYNKSIEDWATQLQSCYYASSNNYTSTLVYNIMLYDLYTLDEIAFSQIKKI